VDSLSCDMAGGLSTVQFDESEIKAARFSALT
jgi:hypothetical protein